jgi:hypothetical protein
LHKVAVNQFAANLVLIMEVHKDPSPVGKDQFRRYVFILNLLIDSHDDCIAVIALCRGALDNELRTQVLAIENRIKIQTDDLV